jgi:hypothetical protein
MGDCELYVILSLLFCGYKPGENKSVNDASYKKSAVILSASKNYTFTYKFEASLKLKSKPLGPIA